MYHRGNSVREARNLVLASYTRHAGPGTLRWRLYYDQYKYDDRFDYPAEDGGIEDVRALQRGDALGGQATFQFGLRNIGELLAGVSVDGELRDLQQDRTVYPSLVYQPAISDPDSSAAFFAQQEWKATRTLAFYGGLRFDLAEQGPELSPRLAAVWRPGKTTYKLVYGRPFRQPSSFERLYTDGGKSWLANPGLRSETGQTLELSAERNIGFGFKAIVNAYHYRLDRVIQARYDEDGIAQYWNSGWARSEGLEAELESRRERFEVDASYGYQVGRRRNDPRPENVPSHIAKFRGAVPLANKRLWLSSSLQYMSSRQTRSQRLLRPVALLDLTLSTSAISRRLDLQAGVRNLAGWRYSDPVDLGIESMPANRRSWFLKITYHVSD
jgi:outer membrane cobalamin receptor